MANPPRSLRLHLIVSSFWVAEVAAMKVSDILFFSLEAISAYALDIKERQLSWTVGQTVQTSSGPVNGHPAGTAKQVSEYLGIPYALSPVGNRM